MLGCLLIKSCDELLHNIVTFSSVIVVVRNVHKIDERALLARIKGFVVVLGQTQPPAPRVVDSFHKELDRPIMVFPDHHTSILQLSIAAHRLADVANSKLQQAGHRTLCQELFGLCKCLEVVGVVHVVAVPHG